MIIEVGEDFKKEFNRKLDNWTARVRFKLKEHHKSPSTLSRWSEPVESFGLLRDDVSGRGRIRSFTGVRSPSGLQRPGFR